MWEIYGEGGGQFTNLKDARECARQYSQQGNDYDGYGEPGEVNIWKDGTIYFTYNNGKIVYDGWTLKKYKYNVKNLETFEVEEVTVNKKLEFGVVYNLSDGRRITLIDDNIVKGETNDKSEKDGVDDGDVKECIHLKDQLKLKHLLVEKLKTHSQLNKSIFNIEDNTLKQDVRVRLCEIADMFVESIQEDNIPIKVYDYWLVGSNAAYNYTQDSDIDVHIIVDMEMGVNPYLLRLLYDYVKSSFNDKYDIMVKGHEVELYLEDIKTTAVTNGIYSLKQDKWIKVPQQQEDKDYYVEETDLYNEVYKRFSDLQDSEAEQFLDDLYILRKESLASEGEFGLGNLIFKEFRNRGYIDELKDMKYRYKSQELTLENLGCN